MRSQAKKTPRGRSPQAGTRRRKRRLAGTGRESKASRETFSKRTRKPGAVGLANEARAGLGSRGKLARRKKSGTLRRGAVREDREPLGRNAPVHRPAPREQPANSVAHELERHTGVSGHMAAD